MSDASIPASPPSTASGGTTLPNTPRQEHEERVMAVSDPPTANQSLLLEGEEFSGESETPFDELSSSDQRTHDIRLTWPRRVDQSKIPALVCWSPAQRLDDMSLDIHWSPRGNAGNAFFRLHISSQLDGAPTNRRDGRTNLYVFIYPERIQQLSLDVCPKEKWLGPNTVALQFNMSRPPALVLPKNALGHDAWASIKKLRGFARQLSFTLYAAIPRRSLPLPWVQQLCTAVSNERLSSIMALANTKSLYGGHGAEVIEGESLPESELESNDVPAAHPPAYDDVGLSSSAVRPSPCAPQPCKHCPTIHWASKGIGSFPHMTDPLQLAARNAIEARHPRLPPNRNRLICIQPSKLS